MMAPADNPNNLMHFDEALIARGSDANTDKVQKFFASQVRASLQPDDTDFS